MLRQLDIHNIALIDNISIELGVGFNILTGETGAGKSIIIDSINAILGERISKDLIRTGKEKAIVEAIFEVENERMTNIFEHMGIVPEEDGTLIISREFNLAGKNICRINGKMATVSMLKEIGEWIIDIHGQFDNQSLLRTDSHIKLLDLFGGEKIEQLKHNYLNILADYKSIKGKLKEISGNIGERERRIDLLRFQIEEITNAALQPDEEEKLNKQRVVLSNSEKIIQALSSAYEFLLSGNNIKSSASDNLNEALSELNGIAKLGENLSDIRKRLEEVSYQLDDITEEIRKERDNVEYNPDMLESIEERLDFIFKLKRKYGISISEIQNYCKKSELELQELNDCEGAINRLNSRLKLLNEELYKSACLLNAERKKAAEILENEITVELNDLEMKKAKFKVNIEFDEQMEINNERKYTQNGLDRIEFLISPNTGEPLKPLSKIASGGEMSRIMLAIKTILADVDEIPTMIFDEIDIGVSGRAAQRVGEKLSFISKNHQVLCVTHLAQIASMADNHYLIEKFSNEESTETKVQRLKGNCIRDEIARILGGSNISDITLKHAEEMLENAKKIKKN
jgi:DNA repair protein RecN (Recombination protein N)